MTAQNKKESQRSTPQPRPHARKQDGLDPSRAPEEGSATQTKQKGDLLKNHKTDESGAPVD